MNKYQEALHRLSAYNLAEKEEFDREFPNYTYDDVVRDLKTIQELVDKETPIKPYYPPNYPTADCPVCKSNIGDNPRCRECGQVIDWSDEE